MSKREKEKWVKNYKDSIPHWALFTKPSSLAVSFVFVLKKNKLKKEKILEIGCGNGRDSIYFANNGLNIIGIDLSTNALKLAKKNKILRVKNKRFQNLITFKKADAEKLPFSNDYFGGIYSVGVLHSTNLKKSFSEIYRVLKKNGIALIHLWQETLFLKTAKKIISCEPDKLKRVLDSVGFKILKFDSIKAKHVDLDSDGREDHLHYAIIVKIKKP